MASAQEDKIVAEEHFFEGAEKLLEVWFDSSSGHGDLRSLPRYYDVDQYLCLLNEKVYFLVIKTFLSYVRHVVYSIGSMISISTKCYNKRGFCSFVLYIL